jgi:hypothetical protein
VAVVADLPPIGTESERRLSIHMVQHLLIGDLAALLIAVAMTGPLLPPGPARPRPARLATRPPPTNRARRHPHRRPARLRRRGAARGRGRGPHESDPRHALAAFRIPIHTTALWRWPFAPGVDYLACATLAGAPTVEASGPAQRALDAQQRREARSDER